MSEQYQVDPEWKALPREEQQRLFEEYMQDWLKIGMCPDPADVPMALEGIKGCYRAINQPEPFIIAHAQSPLAATVTGPIYELMMLRLLYRGDGVEERPVTDDDPPPSLKLLKDRFAEAKTTLERLRSEIASDLDPAAWLKALTICAHAAAHTPWRPTEKPSEDADSVDDVPQDVLDKLETDAALAARLYFGNNLLDYVFRGTELKPTMLEDVEENQVSATFQPVVEGINSVILDTYRPIVEEINAVLHLACVETVSTAADILSFIKRVLYHRRGGNLWAGWHGEIGYYRDVCKLQHPEFENFKYDEMLSKSCGWVWFGRYAAAFSDRALYIRMNENNLHCNDGPVAEWPDGSKFYMLDGTVVDEQIVMHPETQTVDQILHEPNAEVRRHRMERFGIGRLLDESNAQILDERINERDLQQERLYKLTLGENDVEHRFRCVDPSTKREYFPQVPVEVTTCQGAQDNLSHGLDKRLIHRS